MTHRPPRAWEVLLLGGPSGVGKTSVSYPLAHHFGVGITEIDDFQVVLETLTTPREQPVLHFFRTHPDPASLTPKQLLEQTLKVAEVMAPALEAVVANHLETRTPVVLEGDFLLPTLAARADFAGQPNAGRVRAVFLHEQDEGQLVANFSAREPGSGVQAGRARVSLLYGRYLREEAERLGLPALPARPWDNLLARVLETLR